jgi:hypothetical protein
MSLVDNCVNVLGEEAVVLSHKETDILFSELSKQFSFTSWGRIDWTSVEHKLLATSVSEILSLLVSRGKGTSEAVFILWDQVKLPAIKSDIQTVLHHSWEVTMVSFDTWIFCPENKYVIEFYHEGEITIGWND